LKYAADREPPRFRSLMERNDSDLMRGSHLIFVYGIDQVFPNADKPQPNRFQEPGQRV
jgi:hypothetical protein